LSLGGKGNSPGDLNRRSIGTIPITKYNRGKREFMAENVVKPTWLRVAAAAILGCMLGGILFLFAVLIIGAVNDSLGMAIPINMRLAENIWSSVLLIVLIGFSIAGLWWKVETTPPSEPENPDSGLPDE
jgi:hypothetical protein